MDAKEFFINLNNMCNEHGFCLNCPLCFMNDADTIAELCPFGQFPFNDVMGKMERIINIVERYKNENQH